ncbi:nuclear transport factor 2 family protein [Sphingobacterium hungaricum]|uniref:Lumazine-binding n=1 Tax=Sphingobacterium hungaricum TaxID=2082723 RepID=A0A928UW88_9SPHI|nr:nuclear transport factor 2 family protein [Sphingobacterium hungaricum]MBE8714466.1 hypothetical protein [Sphingobacterium hungaricum]
MQNLIKIIAASVLMVFSFNSFATEKESPAKITKAVNLVDAYIETATLGKTAKGEYIFADHFQHRVNGSKSQNFNKKQVVKFLSAQEGYVQNCASSYQIIESDSNYTIAKVQMKYDNFTRTDYVTMTLANDAWQIDQVVTSYSN